MELLDLYDKKGRKTGKQKPRGTAPEKDEFLKIVHVCIMNQNGQLLIQKRSDSVQSYPGLWDLSAGGHVLSGETAYEALVRETKEELGLTMPPLSDKKKLRYLFTEQFLYVLDDIYLWHLDISPEMIAFQKDEISAVKWASYKEIIEGIRSGTFVDYTEACIQKIFACSGNAI